MGHQNIYWCATKFFKPNHKKISPVNFKYLNWETQLLTIEKTKSETVKNAKNN